MKININAIRVIAAVCCCALPATAALSDERIAPVDIVNRYYSQFQKTGFLVDELLAFYSDDVYFTDPTFGIVAQGKGELRKLYADLGTDKTNYSNIAWRIEKTVAEADMIVIRGNWSGRFFDCDFDVEFTTLWQLRDGLIAEQTDFFAASAFDRQVGWDDDSGVATCPAIHAE